MRNSGTSTNIASVSSAGATFDLSSAGTISSNAGANVSARDIMLTSTGGGFALTSNLIAPDSITLTARDSMVAGNFNSALTSNRVNLTSTAGSIGDQVGGTRLTVNAANLSANAASAGQDVFIRNTGASTSIVAASSAGDVFDLLSSGALTVSAQTTGNSVNLTTAAGSSAGIAFGASVTGTNTILVSADGAGNITRTAPLAVLTGTDVTLRSGTGNIGDAATPILTVAQQLTANTNGGNVYITNTSANLAVNASSGANVFQVLNAGNIRTTGVISAVGVTFRNTAGNSGIEAGDDVVASGTIVLATIGSGNISQSAGEIRSARLELSSGTGSFGTSSNALDTRVGTVTLNSGGSGYVSEVDAIVIDASTMGQEIVMTVPGGVTTADNVSANRVVLTTPSLTNNFNVSGTALVQVESAGNVQVSGTGNIQSANITFNSTNGSVTADQNTLNGPLSGIAGVSYSARAAAGSVNGAIIEARNGNIQLDAATGVVGTTTNARLTASNDITLLGTAGASLNDGSRFMAGRAASGWGSAGMIQDANSVLSNGSILVDNYRGGSGTGDVLIGNDVQFTAHGGATIGGVTKLGNLGIASSPTGSVFADGNNISFTSYGGWIWISGGDDVTFGNGARFMSAAHLDDNDGTQSIGGQTVPMYYGGGVGIYAGMSGLDIGAALQGLTVSRVPDSKVLWPAGGIVDDTTNTFNVIGGGTFNITLSTPGSNMANIHNNIATANGGVIVLDPPTPGNAVVLNNANILALAPTIGVVPIVVCLTCGTTGNPTVGNPPAPTPPLIVPVVTKQEAPVASVAYQNDNTPRHVGITQHEEKILCQVPLKLQEPVQDQETLNWLIVAADCQSIELPNGNIVASAGTRVAADHGKVRFDQGRMVVVSEKGKTVVATQEGTVVVPAQSVAVLNRNEKGVLRVATLDGEESEFQPESAGPAQTLKASVEREIVIAGVGLDEEELIPTDGVPRESVVSAKLIVPGLKAAQNTFKLKDMMQRDQLLKCEACYKNILLRRIEELRQKAGLAKNPDDLSPPKAPKISILPNLNNAGFVSLGSLEATQPTIAPSLALPSAVESNVPIEFGSSQLKPIAFASPASITTTKGMRTITADRATLLHMTASKVAPFGEHLELVNGEAVVHATKDTVVKVAGYTVKLSAGSAVHVKRKDDAVVVRNLMDPRGGSVQVVAGRGAAVVRVGTEAILATGSGQPSQLLSREAVGRRRISNSMLNNHHLVLSEVSFVSMVSSSDLLQSLFNSGSADHKDLRAKLLKTAACLGVVTASHGTYSNNGDSP